MVFVFFAILDAFVGLKFFRRLRADAPVWKVKVSVLYCIFLLANYLSLMLGRGWLVVGGSEGLADYQLIVFLISFVMVVFHLLIL